MVNMHITLLTVFLLYQKWKRIKTTYIKIKEGNPSYKSIKQMKAQVDTTQRKKNENQQSMKNKEKETLCKYDPRLQNDNQW